MTICFFGCLRWFDCAVDISPSISSGDEILTEITLDPIDTENNGPLLVE